jgi:hypothetical protein
MAARRDALPACTANVIISVLSTCLYYRLVWSLQLFPAFAVQLGAIVQVALCGALLCLLDCTGVAPRAQQHAVSCARWLELAGWLALQNTLEIAAVDGLGSTNGALTPVLQQAVVPITLGLSIALLGRRYAALHWLAAGLVIAGIAASYAPTVSSGDVPWGAAALYVASRLPQSLANVRLEPVMHPTHDGHAVGAADADPRSLTARVGAKPPPRPYTRAAQLRTVLRAGFWTALLGLAFNPMASLLLAFSRGHGVEVLLRDYRYGAACLAMHNVTRDDPTLHGGCDGTAAQAAAAFAIPGVLFAVSEFHVVQTASSAAYFLLVALELPLQAAALAAPAVMGDLASTFRPSLLFGVPLVVVGLVVWARAERPSRALDRTLVADVHVDSSSLLQPP